MPPCTCRDSEAISPFGSVLRRAPCRRRRDKILTHLSFCLPLSFSSVCLWGFLFQFKAANAAKPRCQASDREREKELAAASAPSVNYVRPDTMKYPLLLRIYNTACPSLCSVVRLPVPASVILFPLFLGVSCTEYIVYNVSYQPFDSSLTTLHDISRRRDQFLPVVD